MSAVPVLARDVRIVPLGGERVAEMIATQDTVCAQLALPELYFPLSTQEMQELVGPDGLCVGAERGGRLIGFFGVLFMGERDDNVGQDMGLAAQDLPLVAYFKATNVLPEYRGAGLQKRMTHALFAAMGATSPPGLSGDSSTLSHGLSMACEHPYKWLSSTVSPRNLASLKSFLDSGFWIQGLKPKYLGNMRYLMLRQQQAPDHQLTDSIAVPLLDYDTQVDLLGRGWRGVALNYDQAAAQIHYIRAKG